MTKAKPMLRDLETQHLLPISNIYWKMFYHPSGTDGRIYRVFQDE